jgi:hypothetical protein
VKSNVDKCLLAQIEFKTTGANVHKIRNLVSIYVWAAAHRGRPRSVRRIHKKMEAMLRAFVATGSLEDAELVGQNYLT